MKLIPLSVPNVEGDIYIISGINDPSVTQIITFFRTQIIRIFHPQSVLTRREIEVGILTKIKAKICILPIVGIFPVSRINETQILQAQRSNIF